MRIFRELIRSDDQPTRREQRRRPSPTKDEGDLFSHRPSPRKIRILLDVEHLPDDDSDSVRLFEALLDHERVFALAVESSTVMSSDHQTSRRPGFIRVRDVTEDAGDFGYRGLQLGWMIDDENTHLDGSSTMASRGCVYPARQIGETKDVYDRWVQDRADFSVDDAVNQAIVAEVARKAGFDILVSDASAAACHHLPIHDRVVVLSRAEAVPVIAHYLRRQHLFLADPTVNGYYATQSRHVFYAHGVHVLAPALREWEAWNLHGSSPLQDEVRFRYVTIINRLARALGTRDDLIERLGHNLDEAGRVECMDDFDHLLLMLCGAVDVTARALHLAFGLDECQEQNAKLHLNNNTKSWYHQQIVERFGEVPDEADALADLNLLRADIQVIFELRNSIHNVHIQPVLTIPPIGTPRPRGGINFSAHITDSIIARIKDKQPDAIEEWDFQESGSGGALADVWALTNKAIETTFGFLDLLSQMIFRNPPLRVTSNEPAQQAGAPMPSPTPLEGFTDYLPVLLGFTTLPRRVDPKNEDA